MILFLRCLFFVPVVCLAVLLTGCPFSNNVIPPIPPPLEPPPLTNISPENLLRNLRATYNAGDLEGFSDLLDEEYNFIFSQEDQGEPGIPLGLSKDDELMIHANLFSDLVDRLELEFQYDPGEIVFDQELTVSAADSIWRLEVTQVQLVLKGRLPGHPEMLPMTWEMDNGSQIFWFRKATADEAEDGEGVDPETGLPLWTICQWEETTMSGHLSLSLQL
jgi:hypothetical protein